MLSEASGTLDEAIREAKYYELQKLYVDNALGIPLHQVVDNFVMRDYIKGYYYRPLWQDVILYYDLEKDTGATGAPGFTLITGLAMIAAIVLVRKNRKPRT